MADPKFRIQSPNGSLHFEQTDAQLTDREDLFRAMTVGFVQPANAEAVTWSTTCIDPVSHLYVWPPSP